MYLCKYNSSQSLFSLTIYLFVSLYIFLLAHKSYVNIAGNDEIVALKLTFLIEFFHKPFFSILILSRLNILLRLADKRL